MAIIFLILDRNTGGLERIRRNNSESIHEVGPWVGAISADTGEGPADQRVPGVQSKEKRLETQAAQFQKKQREIPQGVGFEISGFGRRGEWGRAVGIATFKDTKGLCGGIAAKRSALTRE